MPNCRLSIIIPSFNDAHIIDKNLPLFVNFLTQNNITHEIIIIDDGSDNRQKTEEIARKYTCQFLFNEKNYGKGAAVRKGMQHAQGEYCIYTDVDIPFKFESITSFLKYLDFKEFDLVVGDRTLPESDYYTKITPLRQLGSNIFSFIVGRFIAGGFFDTQCGIKGFRAAAARDIFSHAKVNGFAFDVEVLYIALKRNYDIKRLPVKLRSNEGNSVKLFYHGFGMLLDLLSIRWNYFLGKYNNISVKKSIHAPEHNPIITNKNG